MLPQGILTRFPELRKGEWRAAGQRPGNCILHRDLYAEAFQPAILERLFAVKAHAARVVYINDQVFLDTERYREFADRIVARIQEDAEAYAEMLKRFENACSTVHERAKALQTQSFAQHSLSELEQEFGAVMKELTEMIAFAYLSHNQEEIPRRLIEGMLEKIPEQDRASLMKKILQPARKTLLQEERDALGEIQKDDKKQIQQHITTYPWLNSHYFRTKTVTEKEIIERMQKLQPEEEKESFPTFAGKEARLVALIQEHMYLKTLRKELLKLMSYAIQGLFERIAAEQELTFDEFLAQRATDIQQFLTTGTKEQQTGGYAYVCTENVRTLIPFEASIELQQEENGLGIGTDLVHGQAIVLEHPDDASKTQSHQILVADTITPGMTSNITKAKGIITNAGGVLSHAAVLARELDVPALLGTGNATSKLKTGSYVELNPVKKRFHELLNTEKKFRKMFAITMGVCRADLYMPTHVFNTADVIGRGHDDIIFTIADNKNTGYFSEEVITYMGEVGLKHLQSKEFVKRNQQEVHAVGESLMEFATSVNAHPLKNLSKEKLLELYNKLFDKIQKSFGYFNVSQPCISFALEDTTRDVLAKLGIDAEAQITILETMLKPEETTLIEEEEKDLLQLALQLKDAQIDSKEQLMSSAYADHVLLHHAKYKWMASSENFDEFNLQYYCDRLLDHANETKQSLQAAIRAKTPDKKALAAERAAMAKQYRLSDEAMHLLDVIRIYSHQRMYIRIAWTKAVNAWGNILREFARRMGLSEQEIQYVTRKEIDQFVQHSTVVSEEEIQQRMDFAVYAILQRKPPILLAGDEARAFAAHYLPAAPSGVDEVKGKTGNKGTVQGPVKILAYGKNMVKQIEEMEPGSVLVTGNTRPDMMLAIHKSIAIVTDEGGIMSHAALVSRELGIPCVIGTKDGTHVFEDGDIVEVDADEGVVRRIRGERE